MLKGLKTAESYFPEMKMEVFPSLTTRIKGEQLQARTQLKCLVLNRTIPMFSSMLVIAMGTRKVS
ncbi:Uncharacterised protein [Raoultella ornithinolytica]|nr:Uncharacterised protein [Raoultella ornithinolytica]